MASSEDYTITTEEAYRFVRDVLKIESAETKLKASKVNFLDELIKAFGHHIPYQTVKGISVPPGERRLPTASVIKNDVMSKLGGICYQLNIFCWMLLRGLGLDAWLITSYGFHLENTHPVIILNGVTTAGSKHLVDVGNGYQTFKLFPLDFKHSSPVYDDSFMKYRFLRESEDVVIFQLSVESKPAEARGNEEFIRDGWLCGNFMRIGEPVKVSQFDKTMTDYLTVVNEKLFFLTSLRCLTYPKGRLVCIKDTKLMIEDENGQRQTTYFRSRDEILNAFARYFPQIPKEMIKSAMDHVQIKFDKE